MLAVRHSVFLRCFGIVLLLIISVVAGFNIVVDSYGIFGIPLVRGINAEKHGQDRHPRIAKAYAVRSFRPEIVILGTSRAESTFDPLHPFFQGKRTYNLAFPGAAVYEQKRFLQHAAGVGKLTQAVFAVDFFQFLGKSQRVSEEFNEEILAVGSDGGSNIYPWRDVLRLAATGSALKDSWWSLRRQKTQPSIYRADGYRNDSGDIPEMLAKLGGQRNEFVRSERLYVGNYGQTRNMLSNVREVGHSAHDDMEKLLPWAKERGIDLIVLIPPVHARHLELISQLGRWDEMETWKARLVSEVSAVFGEHACVWDFSGFNEITTEILPQDSKGRMHWWRESSHASSATGWRMLDRIQKEQGAKSDFGLCLTLSGLSAAFANERKARTVWESRNPGEVHEIMQMIAVSRTRSAE